MAQWLIAPSIHEQGTQCNQLKCVAALLSFKVLTDGSEREGPGHRALLLFFDEGLRPAWLQQWAHPLLLQNTANTLVEAAPVAWQFSF